MSEVETTEARIKREIDENTIIITHIERGIQSRQRRMRNIVRFMFSHGDWTNDRQWLKEHRPVQDKLHDMNEAAVVLLERYSEGGRLSEGGTIYYDTLNDIRGRSYYVGRYMPEPSLTETT